VGGGETRHELFKQEKKAEKKSSELDNIATPGTDLPSVAQSVV
jgi:hypothetical protein